MEHPNAKKHQQISFLKSGIRILGYIVLLFNLNVAVSLLVISEVIGILEELDRKSTRLNSSHT